MRLFETSNMWFSEEVSEVKFETLLREPKFTHGRCVVIELVSLTEAPAFRLGESSLANSIRPLPPQRLHNLPYASGFVEYIEMDAGCPPSDKVLCLPYALAHPDFIGFFIIVSGVVELPL